jgi:hypothetical protein
MGAKGKQHTTEDTHLVNSPNLIKFKAEESKLTL